MNLLSARLLTTADVDGVAHRSVTIRSMTRSLASPLEQRLRAPSDVVLGISPEHFDSVPIAFGSGGLDGVVRVVEPPVSTRKLGSRSRWSVDASMVAWASPSSWT